MADPAQVDGASFAFMVPGEGNPPVPAYADLVRLGALDRTDEPRLPVDPAKPTGRSFADLGQPPPFAAGALTYTIDTLQFLGPDGYLRIGQPGGYERWLTMDPDDPQPPTPPAQGGSDTPLGGSGIALHSDRQVVTFAPVIIDQAKTITQHADSITTYSHDSIAAVYTGAHSIGTLTATTEGMTGLLTNAKFQVGNAFQTTIGATVSSVAGSGASMWTGHDVSAGIGSLLKSNIGVTSNLYFGSVVTMNNASVGLGGFGSSRIGNFEIVSPQSVSMAVAPATFAGTESYRMMKIVQAVTALTALANTVLLASIEGTVRTRADAIGDREANEAALKAVVRRYDTVMAAITGLTGAVQVLSILSGIMLQNAKKKAWTQRAASFEMTAGTIVLSAGGTKVTIGGNGFRVDAGNPEQVEFAQEALYSTVLSGEAYDLAASEILQNLIRNPDHYENMSGEEVSLPWRKGSWPVRWKDNAYENRASQFGVPRIQFNSATLIQVSSPEILFKTLT